MTEAKATTTRSRAKKVEEVEEAEAGAATMVPETTPASDLNIYQRINLISQEAGALAPEAKGGVPFAFRGIDGTVAHLSYFMNKYGVIAAPGVVSHIVTEREVLGRDGNPSGRIVKTSQVEVMYKFYGPAGDFVEVTTPGLADDFADRSSAQAMSVAYRIALLQLFHLPTHTKEPEETGQDVISQREAIANGSATSNVPQAVQQAQAASGGAAAKSLVQLQAEAKAIGKALNLGVAELNSMGAEVNGGADTSAWFNDHGSMVKLVEALKAKQVAARAS